MTREEKIQDQLEILAHVVETYRNPNNRGFDKDKNNCMYFVPAKDGRCKEKRCAVGMYLNDDQIMIAANYTCDVPSLLRLLYKKNLLDDPGMLKGHLSCFWQKLQYWHDYNYNFTSHGISKSGRDEIKEIQIKIKLGYYL